MKTKKKRMKRLTERQAWLVVAAMFRYPARGMCVATVRLDEQGLLSEKVARKMSTRIARALHRRDETARNEHPDFLFPPRDVARSDWQRVDFARRAAAAAKS